MPQPSTEERLRAERDRLARELLAARAERDELLDQLLRARAAVRRAVGAEGEAAG